MKSLYKLAITLLTLVLLSSCGKNSNIDSYVGSYYGDEAHQRVRMEVSKLSNKKLSFEVTWSSSAFEEYVWSFESESENNIFKYTNCTKVLRQYQEDGSYSTPEIAEYVAGQGKIIFDDSFVYWISMVKDESFDEQIKFIKNIY